MKFLCTAGYSYALSNGSTLFHIRREMTSSRAVVLSVKQNMSFVRRNRLRFKSWHIFFERRLRCLPGLTLRLWK
jgi:hypothetical protein